MTVNEAYRKFKLKVNENNGGKNIAADKPRFVLIYNEIQVRRLIRIYRQNDDRIREIQFFLTPNKAQPLASKQKDRNLYSLPSDYLEISSVYGEGKKGNCTGTIYLHEIKDKNYSYVLTDNAQKPSFEYREAPFEITNNNINVFTGDFDIPAVYLSYYRTPRKIDIAGYLHDDLTASTDIDPEGDDRWVDNVLSEAAAEFSRNNADVQEVNLNKDRQLN